jgi:NTP pyrophosphatase (non-canonical NTP hydrolase)
MKKDKMVKQIEKDIDERVECVHRNVFKTAYNKVAEQVHRTAREKGWWDKKRNDGEAIALMHSELSEALEALRHGNPPDDKIPEFNGAEAELADVIIRILDFGQGRGLRVAEALVAKMDYNRGRERMHGGKKF